MAWFAAELLEATILNAATEHFLYGCSFSKDAYLSGGAIFFMKK